MVPMNGFQLCHVMSSVTCLAANFIFDLFIRTLLYLTWLKGSATSWMEWKVRTGTGWLFTSSSPCPRPLLRQPQVCRRTLLTLKDPSVSSAGGGKSAPSCCRSNLWGPVQLVVDVGQANANRSPGCSFWYTTLPEVHPGGQLTTSATW